MFHQPTQSSHAWKCLVAFLLFTTMASGEATSEGSAAWPLERVKKHLITPEPRSLATHGGSIELRAPGIALLVRGDHRFDSVVNELQQIFADTLTVHHVAADGGVEPTMPANRSGTIIVGAATANAHTAAALMAAGLDAGPGHTHPEAYLLDVRSGAHPTIVLAGNSERGDFYAVQSLKQIVQKTEQGWRLPTLSVRDWPSFEYRGIKRIQKWPEWMPQYKMNFVWYYGRNLGWSNYLHVSDDAQRLAKLREKHRALVEKHARRYVHVLVNYSPGHVLDATPQRVAAVKNLYSEWYRAGVRLFGLSFDDMKSELTEETAQIYPDYATAQAAYCNAIYDHLQELQSGLDLYLCHQWYAGFTTAGENARRITALREAGLKPQIKLQWTGSRVTAPEASLDMARSFAGYFGLTTGLFYDNWPEFDNSIWHLEFGPVRKRDPKLSEDVDIMMYCPEPVYRRGDGQSIQEVACVTGADYAWNSEGYEPERAFSRAILAYAGEAAYDDLYAFAYPFSQHWLGHPDRDLPVPGSHDLALPELHKRFDQQTTQFRQRFEAMKGALKDRGLVDDIEHWLTRVRGERWERLKNAIFKRFSVPYIDGITIDGVLDEEGWERALKVDEFFNFLTHKQDPKKTTARVGYDDHNLYIAVYCPRSDMATMFEDETQKWRSDNLEIFLDLDNDKERFEHHLCVFTTERVNVFGTEDPAKAAAIKRRVTKHENHYIYEVALPFSFLGKRALAGHRWGMHIARNEFRAPKDGEKPGFVYGAVWCLVEQKYNQPDQFAEVQFEQ